MSRESDAVNSPRHYTSRVDGVECIEVVEWLGFNLGNAVKYVWRAGLKGDIAEDYRKALWYFRREIDRLRRQGMYGSARPQASTEAAHRALAVCVEGVLRDVLNALYSTSGDYVTVLQLLEATAYVQQALDAEVPYTVRFTPLPPKPIAPELVDPRETSARMEAAGSAHREPGVGTVTKSVTP